LGLKSQCRIFCYKDIAPLGLVKTQVFCD